MEEFFTQVLRDFGPLVGAIVFFVWRDWKREGALSSRIIALEETQRDVLLSTIEKTTKVAERSTVVMELNGRALEQNAATMSRVNETLERLMTIPSR